MTLKKAVQILIDRRAWLQVRLQSSKGGMTHDAAEEGALRTVLRFVERTLAEHAEKGLQGDGEPV